MGYPTLKASFALASVEHSLVLSFCVFRRPWALDQSCKAQILELKALGDGVTTVGYMVSTDFHSGSGSKDWGCSHVERPAVEQSPHWAQKIGFAG